MRFGAQLAFLGRPVRCLIVLWVAAAGCTSHCGRPDRSAPCKPFGWRCALQSAPERPVIWVVGGPAGSSFCDSASAPREEEALRNALAMYSRLRFTRVAFRIKNVTLREALAYLSDLARLPIDIQKEAQPIVDSAAQLRLALASSTPAEVLEFLTRSNGLSWIASPTHVLVMPSPGGSGAWGREEVYSLARCPLTLVSSPLSFRGTSDSRHRSSELGEIESMPVFEQESVALAPRTFARVLVDLGSRQLWETAGSRLVLDLRHATLKTRLDAGSEAAYQALLAAFGILPLERNPAVRGAQRDPR